MFMIKLFSYTVVDHKKLKVKTTPFDKYVFFSMATKISGYRVFACGTYQFLFSRGRRGRTAVSSASGLEKIRKIPSAGKKNIPPPPSPSWPLSLGQSVYFIRG
jgi:hypothetical protein